MDEEVGKSTGAMIKSAVFSQIIILIVYLPILSLQGIEGKMFKPMAFTIAFAIFGAFILSITYVPMMAALFLNKKLNHKKNITDRLMIFLERTYQPLLKKVLNIPKAIIVSTIALFAISVILLLNMGWYSQNKYEGYTFWYSRAYLFSPYGWSYWGMMACNVLSPQIFWSRKMRRNVFVTFFMSIIVNIGMWFERFVIIVTSLYRDYLPSSWSVYYSPSIWEIGFYMGTFGLFFTCFFLFAKYFPVIAVAEIKYVLKRSGESYKPGFEKLEAQTLDSFVHDNAHAH